MTALLEIPKRFFRSVQLEHDLLDQSTQPDYTITPQAIQTLKRIAGGLAQTSSERAWTITGPYGGGKSAFALFLSQILSARQTNTATWQSLRAADSDLAEQFTSGLEQGYLHPIALTLRRTSLSRNILEGLHQWINQVQFIDSRLAKLRQEVTHNLPLPVLDTKKVISAFKLALEISQQQPDCKGILLILDELGKALEFAAHNSSEDMYLLQELAELAGRSTQRFVLIGILHQGFEQYAEHLEISARREWGKIQGRFADIAFLEPPAQQMWLASKALKSLNLPDANSHRRTLQQLAQTICTTQAGLDSSTFPALAAQAYPLHPTVLTALPHVFRRFAQNERSLFAYLASIEPFAPLERLQTRGAGLIRLPDLFDYMISAFGNQLMRHSSAKYWLEITDTIEQRPHLSELEIQLIKTVGLLHILSQSSPLQATEALISLALTDQYPSAEIRGALEKCLQHNIFTQRRINNTYRIWEGSDVDIEAQLETGRHIVSAQHSLAKSLEKYLLRRPIVARRHSFHTGTLRAFEIKYLDAPDNALTVNSEGMIVCCLPNTLAVNNAFLEWVKTPEITNRSELVIVIPDQLGSLRENTIELQALYWVKENTPELEQDRVARQELKNRTAIVEQYLSNAVNQLLSPEPMPIGTDSRWFWKGQLCPTPRARDTMQLLSTVLDERYSKTPQLKNELINRRVLSSAAAAARNTLMARLFEQPNIALLGIEGYPPERSMYESLLLATGIHRDNPDGWYLSSPYPNSHLYPAWQELEARVFAALAEPENLEHLYEHLSRPPFGVTQGIMPVLITALLQIYPNIISLYREGTFLPEPSIADLEVLVRRPELFSIAGGKVAGERIAVVTRLAKSLGTEAATMPVIRALMKMVKSLPEYAWRSQTLPKNVLQTRAAFERARSPERLLYIELPEALEQHSFADTGEAEVTRVEAFFDALNHTMQTWAQAYPRLLEQSRNQLLSHCELPQDSEGWEILRAQAKKLDGKLLHKNLMPIVKRLSSSGEETASIESTLALIASRPAKSWTDNDANRFSGQAEAIVQLLLEAKQSHVVLSKAEAAESTKLYKRLKADMKDMPSHILRAALAKLLQEL